VPAPPALGCAVLRWTLGLVAAGILSGFAALLLHGQYFHEGAVIFTISANHGWGIHHGDILVAGGWLIGMIAVVTLVLDGRQSPDER
jgi:hypothetical protein